jgi:hypothetical protein
MCCVLLGGLARLYRFSPDFHQKSDTFFLINRLGQCLLPPVSKKNRINDAMFLFYPRIGASSLAKSDKAFACFFKEDPSTAPQPLASDPRAIDLLCKEISCNKLRMQRLVLHLSMILIGKSLKQTLNL